MFRRAEDIRGIWIQEWLSGSEGETQLVELLDLGNAGTEGGWPLCRFGFVSYGASNADRLIPM